MNSEIRGAYNFRPAAIEHNVLFATWKCLVTCSRDLVATSDNDISSYYQAAVPSHDNTMLCFYFLNQVVHYKLTCCRA